MSDYAVCQIAGKQYKLIPNVAFEVDLLQPEKEVAASVLLLSQNGKVKVGTPFLKENLTLKFLDNIKGEKIRVAKFHAKANFRKVAGHRVKKTRLIWSVKKA